jgi:hypothetical protein
MNGQQRAVLWIGLILVGLNLIGHWQDIRSVIFSGAGITGGIPNSGDSGGGGGLGGIIGGSIGKGIRGIMPGGGIPIPGTFSANPPHKTNNVMV